MDNYKFTQLGSEGVAETDVSGVDLGRVEGIKVSTELVLGSTETLISDVLRWRIGDIVELDALYGDSMVLRVSGRDVGRGELVVLDDSTLGIKIVKLGNNQ